jgi:hypothetical protein
MTRNVTLRVDEEILRECRFAAVEEDRSLSQWIVDQITNAVQHRKTFKSAKSRAVRRLATGYHLGGKPLSRESLHER